MTDLSFPTAKPQAAITREDAFQIASNAEQKYGLPEGTLWKMSGIENNALDPNAVSPKGAKGFFQFTEPTAKTYGVTVGDYASEADGAARYMVDNQKKYNGNIDLSLADYNGGPKAAHALASGKPWPETSEYLSRFHGGKSEPLSSAFTTGDSITPDSSAGASALHEQASQRARDGGFLNGVANLPGAIGLGFQQDNSVYNWWQERGVAQTDPTWAWNDENSAQYLNGVPEKNWDYILQAKSQGEADFRRSRMQQSMENEQKLSEMGVAGFTGRLVGGLADLPTLIAFVPGLGGEGLLTATSRIANAVRMGMVGAASNVAYDAVANQYKPMATTDDLYISAAMGLGLGALGGAAVSPARVGASRLAEENARLAKFGQKASAEAQKTELVDHGFDWSAGRQEFQRTIDAHLARPTPPKPNTAEDWARIDAGVSAREAREAQAKAPVEPEVQAIRTETEAAKETPTVTITGNRVGSVVNAKSTQSGREYLTSLAENSKDGLQATLAARLLDNLNGDVPIHTVNKSELGGRNVRGTYDPQTHSIKVYSGTTDDTKLHELAHAATVYKVKYGLANPESAHGQLVKQLQDIYQSVKSNMSANGVSKFDDGSHYYMSNLDEFIAGLYSGKTQFRDYLAKAKVDASSDTALARIMDIFRKLLGMNNGETNALVKSLGLVDQLKGTNLNVTLKAHSFEGADFGRGSMSVRQDAPHLEAAHPSVDAPTVDAANAAKIPTVFGWGLGLENRLGGAKAPQEVRDLASKLFGTTVGYKDHSVVRTNAWDDTTKWADGWATEMRKTAYPAFEKWFKDQKLPFHKKGEAYEDFGTQVSDYIRGREGEYAPEVRKAGDSVRNTLAKVVDYINNPAKDEGGVKLGLTEQELRHPETGEVTVVGKLEKNENYLPRKHDTNKWNSMVTAYGHEAVQGWWARAFQKGRPNISDEAAGKWAKWYVRSVEEAHANRTQDLLTGMLQGQDRDALLHSLMVNGNYSHHDAEKLLVDMFPTKESDAGRVNSSLKHRNTIDENHTETWTMKDGSKQEVSLNDFIHTNAFDVVEPYLRRTAGNVALAKHLDIYKNSDIERAIADATQNKFGADMKAGSKVAAMRKDLKFTFDRVLGVPQEEFGTINKSLSMWRDFNVIRLMGGAVWNQMTELSQITGSMGWKATLAAVPELRGLRRDIATGKAPNDILDHLENTIGGVGSEYIHRMEFGAKDDWVRNKGDTITNQWLDKVDNINKKWAKGVLDYTGMTPLTIQQKRVHAVALVNHFVNVANGAESRFLTRERLAWMGMSPEDFSKVSGDIKKFTQPKQGEFGKGYKMDFDGWTKESPGTYSQFMNAIHREARRVVQENDLASMVPLMGSTLGKTVFQFMNFTVHGWNKSLMFAMNHRDWTTVSTMLHGGFLASLAYMGRTLLGSVGMKGEEKREYLDKRLSAQQIVANSFGRISQASLLPNIFDTLSPYPMFSGMRTTSDLSGLASNPTYQAVNSLISMKKLIRNGVSDESQTTSKDMRDWFRLVPLNNVVPVSTLLNALANDYPNTEQQTK